MEIEYKNQSFFTTKDLALSVIGGRWKIAIIYQLLEHDVLRLNQFEKQLSHINQRMLIRQLRELEEDQIVTRTVYHQVPPKVEYQLTEVGKSLDTVVYAICDWGDEFALFLEKNDVECHE